MFDAPKTIEELKTPGPAAGPEGLGAITEDFITFSAPWILPHVIVF